MNSKKMIENLKAAGLSQYRIAKLTGISQATICLVLKGDRPGNNRATVRKLGELYAKHFPSA